MVFGLRFGKKTASQQKVHEEVRFWKCELDRCVDEKNKWRERFASAARHNEILRAEVFLLQQERARLQPHFVTSVPAHSNTSKNAAAPSQREGTPARQAASPSNDDHVQNEFIPTPASQRFRARCCTAPSTRPHARHNSMVSNSMDNQGPSPREEVNHLKQLLQAAQTQNHSLMGEMSWQQSQNEFLSASAQAYRGESELLREELLTQRGINDETADETVKVLCELGRLQQANALLTRDLSLKDGMIQLLQQQLTELNSQVPLTPRARSPQRTGSSSCSEGDSEESEMLQSLWDSEQHQQQLWEAEAQQQQQLPGRLMGQCQSSSAVQDDASCSSAPAPHDTGRRGQAAALDHAAIAQSSDATGSQAAAHEELWGRNMVRPDAPLIASSAPSMTSDTAGQQGQGSRLPHEQESCSKSGAQHHAVGRGNLGPTKEELRAASSSLCGDVLAVSDLDSHTAQPWSTVNTHPCSAVATFKPRWQQAGKGPQEAEQEAQQGRLDSKVLSCSLGPYQTAAMVVSCGSSCSSCSTPQHPCPASDVGSDIYAEDDDDAELLVGVRTPDSSHVHRLPALHC